MRKTWGDFFAREKQAYKGEGLGRMEGVPSLLGKGKPPEGRGGRLREDEGRGGAKPQAPNKRRGLVKRQAWAGKSTKQSWADCSSSKTAPRLDEKLG